MLPKSAQDFLAHINKPISILDFSTVKIQTVIKILYKLVKEQCD
jgi:hypothetical protein